MGIILISQEYTVYKCWINSFIHGLCYAILFHIQIIHFYLSSPFSFLVNNETVLLFLLTANLKVFKTDLCQRKWRWLWGCGRGFSGPAGQFSGLCGEILPSWTQTCPATGQLHRTLNWSWRQSLDRKPTCRPRGGSERWLDKSRTEWEKWGETGREMDRYTEKKYLAVLVRVFLHPHSGQVDLS